MPSLSVICESKAHCTKCREIGPAGDRFRAGLAEGYDVPAGFPACPEGKAMGSLTCARCWGCHAVKDCSIPPDFPVDPAAATAGGCGCDGSQTQDAPRPA